GAAIGFFVGRADPAPREAEVAAKAAAVSKRIEDVGADASAAALRSRIRELEALLAARRAEDSRPVTNAVAADAGTPRWNRRGGMRETMEEIRKNDPQRFTQMTNHFAEMRRNRQERQRARADFLSSVDPSLLSDDRRKTHAAYQELLERREALFEKMADMSLSDEERHGLWREMHGIGEEMGRLAAEERDTLLSVVAESIGLEGDAAAELVETVKDVCDATEVRGGRRGPPRGGR
nr:hypothetical protein [Kiritimatiellia bacterium]